MLNVKPDIRTEDESAQQAVPPVPGASARPPRLLIVDDIADNRAILARRFVRRGYEIAEADGGGPALDMIDREQFDLVLLDVMMPDMSGLDVLRKIRQQHSPVDLPVIMVTAKTQSQDVVEALELGANDYVTKPVDFPVALARANTQVGRKRAEEEVHKANQALRDANEDLERRVSERTAMLLEANQSLKKEIAQRLQSEAETRYLAHHDSLTGLGNRALFQNELHQALSEELRLGGSAAVLLLDLDGFKGVNDSLGHSTGDSLLKCVADRVRDTVGPVDRIARLGGDEFAVLQLSPAQPAAAAALAGRLIEALGAPYIVDGHEVVVGTSIGITVASGGEGSPDELLKRADLAMYRAKADGRGTYRFFELEMDAQAQARRSLEVSLRKALVEGSFELYYQPLVTLSTRKLSGFEALMRWKDPERGFVSPVEFIPVAEEIGLIVPLGEWALRQACAQAATWPEHIKVAVNISPVQFKNSNLVPSVINALAASGLHPSRLELEITESVLLDKTDETLAILRQLHELGTRISLDDFGTGYSSLSYLQNFHFDKIKIDRSFIRDLASGGGNRAIVRAIAGLGVSFGITTTAEGVETEEELSCVESDGCTEVQGYFFSAPKPASQLGDILTRLGQL